MKAAATGFTVVELLLVLVIVSILAVVALPSMRVHLANADVRGVAEELRSGLELARTEAIRRNASVQFQRNGTGWTVVVPGGANLGQDLLVATRANRQTQVSVTTDIDNIAFNGSGWTNPFGQTMNIALQAANVSACRPQGGIYCLNVVVAAGGLIRSCDPSAATGSPTACN